jgi:hypothetical protein
MESISDIKVSRKEQNLSGDTAPEVTSAERQRLKSPFLDDVLVASVVDR